MRAMADREHPSHPPKLPENPSPAGSPPPPARTDAHEEAMICERCGKAEMYRMHAVWRCPACGFKTDCCGW